MPDATDGSNEVVSVDWDRERGVITSETAHDRWETELSRADGDELIFSWCTGRPGARERPDCEHARLRLGDALFGAHGVGAGGRRHRYLPEGTDTRRLPFEAALLCCTGGRHQSLVDCGIALVQATAHRVESGTLSLPVIPAVGLVITPFDDRDQRYIDHEAVERELTLALDGLRDTAPSGYQLSVRSRLDRLARADALHVLAHGEPGRILLQDEINSASRRETWIRRRIREHSLDVRLAFFTVCHSAEGVAQDLRATGAISAAVAFRGELNLAMAEKLTRELWRRLVAGADLDEAVLELRRAMDSYDRDNGYHWPSSIASLVVIHDASAVVPFRDATRAAATALHTVVLRTDGSESGEPRRLDAACVLDRRPGAVIVVDWTGTDLLAPLTRAEEQVVDWARDLTIDVSPRVWDDVRADEEPPEGRNPLVVVLPAGSDVRSTWARWRDEVERRRLVFVTRETRRFSDWLYLGKKLQAVVVGLDTAATEGDHDEDRDIVARIIEGRASPRDLKAMSPRQRARVAGCVSRAARGSSRRHAAEQLCTTDDAAQRWIENSPPDASLPEVSGWHALWPIRNPEMLESLVVGWYRAGRTGEPPWPSLRAAIRQLRSVAASGFDAAPGTYLNDLDLAVLVARSGLAPAWDRFEPSHTRMRGFDALAVAMPPSETAVQLLHETRMWGW